MLGGEGALPGDDPTGSLHATLAEEAHNYLKGLGLIGLITIGSIGMIGF